MTSRIIILVTGISIFACGQQKDLREVATPADSYAEKVTDRMEPTDSDPDNLTVLERSVVFYAPKPEELNTKIIDQAIREGLIQAMGDFAYYASIVSDSLESMEISSSYTNKRYITLNQVDGQEVIDRHELKAPMGMILFDGVEQYDLIPGMQTHLSLLASISDFFRVQTTLSVPLLDYFDPLESPSIHIYSSHSDILNQVGRRIHPSYYSEFGETISKKANRFHMSVYAYHKFELSDSLAAFICRVPSTYDESAVKLYVWDMSNQKIISQKLLAENVWNEKWILVKDSWIQKGSEPGKFSFISRQREARVKDGKRTETDSLSGWQWTGTNFQPLSTTGLSLNDYPLRDWDSYQEPIPPTEITIIDEDFVWLPLETGDLTWENIIMEVPKPYDIDKVPIENRIASLQMDTLITISRTNLRLKFYRAPNDIILVDGEVTDSSIPLKMGIQVGISKMEFASHFDDLSHLEIIPDLIRIRSKSADRIISYSFQQDTLSRIEFTNFIH